MLDTINKQLLHSFNSLSHNPCIELMVQIFVDLPIFILPLFLSVYWVYYSFCKKIKSPDNHKNNLLLIFYSVVFSLGISLIIQQFVEVDRPEAHLEAGAKLLLDHLPDASFPSDHATVSISFLTAIYLAGYKKWFQVLLLPFVLMGVSRIIAGVHWPFDIVAGTIIGILGSYIVFNYISQNKLVKKFNLWIIKILKTIKL